MTSEASSNPTPRPSITNRQLRRMGWVSFVVAILFAWLGADPDFRAMETVVIAFLTHAAACFGMPTVRNIAEGYAPRR